MQSITDAQPGQTVRLVIAVSVGEHPRLVCGLRIHHHTMIGINRLKNATNKENKDVRCSTGYTYLQKLSSRAGYL